MLKYLDENPNVYTQLEKTGETLVTGLKDSLKRVGLPYTINNLGSMYTLFFTDQTCDTGIFGKYFRGMLEKGIYLAPSQFESLFLSTALEDTHLNKILEANEKTLKSL